MRFKKDIATMKKASEAILSLRPVTFHYNTDTKGTPQFGLIAEEVAKMDPGLVLIRRESHTPCATTR
jgi:Chaperone of endosialidase